MMAAVGGFVRTKGLVGRPILSHKRSYVSRAKFQLTEERRLQLMELYNSGISMTVIEKEFNTTDSTLRKYLRSHGVPARPLGAPKGNTNGNGNHALSTVKDSHNYQPIYGVVVEPRFKNTKEFSKFVRSKLNKQEGRI